MVDDSIASRLNTYQPILNIVGSNVFKVNVPQDQGPVADAPWNAVVFKRILDDPFRNIDGKIALNWGTFELRAISNVSSIQARALYDAIRAGFQGHSGGEILTCTFAGGGEDEDSDDYRTHTYEIPAIFHISYHA